jgi:hypothetical protein
MKRSSFLILLGISISILFVLAACSGAATPEFSQAIAPLEVEQEEITSPVETPTEAVQNTQHTPDEIYPAPPSEEVDPETGEEEGYPPPEVEVPTPDPAYPAPEELPEGDPSPDSSNPPPVKVGLEATDPSTVNLASGGLQFVEFFAFW